MKKIIPGKLDNLGRAMKRAWLFQRCVPNITIDFFDINGLENGVLILFVLFKENG
jgi:hypothetical protein